MERTVYIPHCQYRGRMEQNNNEMREGYGRAATYIWRFLHASIFISILGTPPLTLRLLENDAVNGWRINILGADDVTVPMTLSGLLFKTACILCLALRRSGGVAGRICTHKHGEHVALS